ncbi:thiamine diphosphokinase [Candidatus Poriferisodalis sp.]|uniref:thiamine diphosphokinase n=1 Tax=Candidatus Poriferisodalis sp. TaxID=3101277 RepID=UPI003B01526A
MNPEAGSAPYGDGQPRDGTHLDARCVWIVDGGPNAPRRHPPGEPTCVIAVDRGLHHALRLGLRPHVVVGDFDSVDPRVLQRTRDQWPDVLVRRHHRDKAHSDLDMALSFAWGLDPAEVALIAGGGGRLDHLLTSMTMLARPRYAVLPLTAYVDANVVRAATAGMRMELPVGDGNLMTLLAVGGTAHLHTSGLRWNLTPETPLHCATSLGLSNEFTDQSAGILVESGTVLAIQTHGESLP